MDQQSKATESVGGKKGKKYVQAVLERVEKSVRCDKRVSARMKGKMQKMLVKCCTVAELEVAEIKI